MKSTETMISFTWPGMAEAEMTANQPFDKDVRILETVGDTDAALRNRFFICDNLDGLRYLSSMEEERFDLVYIDPPYNTSRIHCISRFPDVNGCEFAAPKVRDCRNEIRDAHVTWLNSIYPRLILATKVLDTCGVCIISIDDTEAASLRILCDCLFGEENFLECIVWERESPDQLSGCGSMKNHDYNLIYAKNSRALLRSCGVVPGHPTLWRTETAGSSYEAREALANLMDDRILFEYPKPQALLSRLFSLYSRKDAKVLDFYAGSGSTGEAVLSLNRTDYGTRTFTLMQDEVPLNAEHPQIKTVPQIGIERLRRIMSEKPDSSVRMDVYQFTDQ